MNPPRLFAIAIALLSAQPILAAPSCFAPKEVEAARFRVLQQQFTVAALNCQTSDPTDPTFSDRYNAFIGRFAPQLQDNSEILYHHFGKGSHDLDRWVTRVANDAGQRVQSQNDFCQQAWDRLDHVLTLAPADLDTYLTETDLGAVDAPLCPAKKKPPAKK